MELLQRQVRRLAGMGSSKSPPWLTVVVDGGAGSRRADADRLHRRCGRAATTTTKTTTSRPANCTRPAGSCRRTSTRRRSNISVQRTEVVVIGQYLGQREGGYQIGRVCLSACVCEQGFTTGCE